MDGMFSTSCLPMFRQLSYCCDDGSAYTLQHKPEAQAKALRLRFRLVLPIPAR
jgi:hypothetical protein